jgi:2-isopropylmalate synthase
VTAARRGGEALIVEPREQAHLAHHVESALPAAYGPRLLHLSGGIVPGADLFITSRSVTQLAGPAEPNVRPHRHTVSQTYLFFSPDDSLELEVELDGQRSQVRAPASVFIPAGMEHALRILRGTGTVLSIVRSGAYD